jgi:hypothetical protein
LSKIHRPLIAGFHIANVYLLEYQVKSLDRYFFELYISGREQAKTQVRTQGSDDPDSAYSRAKGSLVLCCRKGGARLEQLGAVAGHSRGHIRLKGQVAWPKRLQRLAPGCRSEIGLAVAYRVSPRSVVAW